MNNDLLNKITAWEPRAVRTEGGDGMFTVPADGFHDLAGHLRADGFDFLRSLTGMDWGEAGFGVVYHLEATATGENVVLRTLTPDRERPVLPSVCDLWKAAELNEREAFDYFGIRFLNHPDMRRLFLRDDWAGHPLRKDFDPAQNPLRMSNEVSKDSSPTYELQPDGSYIRKRNVLFEEDEYVINIGPQHPATHGVLRFRVSLEGEIIRKLDVHCGYIHRGIEKMCEELTYPQTLALTDRLDYLGAAQNRHALCMCIEKGLGVEVPERVQYIRTIMDELQRIDSHLLFFSCLCMDMGALTAFFYGFRDREKVLDILEQTTGGRLIQTYNTIGGVQADIHPDFVRKTKEFIAYMRPKLREYHEVFTGNVIAQERLKGTGVLTREDAVSFGATGGTGRASGWACDVRKRHPYAAYGKVDFEEVLFTEGDCFARYMATETATETAAETAAETTSYSGGEPYIFQHPAKSPRKQNRTHGPSAVKYSKSAGFRDLKTLPESFAALRHGTVFHLRSRTNSGGNRSRHECCTPLRQWNKGGSGSFPNQDIWIK